MLACIYSALLPFRMLGIGRVVLQEECLRRRDRVLRCCEGEATA